MGPYSFSSIVSILTLSPTYWSRNLDTEVTAQLGMASHGRGRLEPGLWSSSVPPSHTGSANKGDISFLPLESLNALSELLQHPLEGRVRFLIL